MKIYLAHPISGLSYDEVAGYYDALEAYLHSIGHEVLTPMRGKEYLRTERQFRAQGYDNPVSTNHAIRKRDRWMVGESDIVHVDLTGAKEVSMGCVTELTWGEELHKHVILVMEKENVHRHAFILEAADIIFETLDESKAYLAKLAPQQVWNWFTYTPQFTGHSPADFIDSDDLTVIVPPDS